MSVLGKLLRSPMEFCVGIHRNVRVHFNYMGSDGLSDGRSDEEYAVDRYSLGLREVGSTQGAAQNH